MVPEAADDAAAMRQFGTLSSVIVPLEAYGSILGSVTFATARRRQAWPRDLVAQFERAAQLRDKEKQLLGQKAEPAGSYSGKADEALWLPNQRVAKAWADYVTTGAVSDTTPPPAPTHVKAMPKPDNTVEITFNGAAGQSFGAFLAPRLYNASFLAVTAGAILFNLLALAAVTRLAKEHR